MEPTRVAPRRRRFPRTLLVLGAALLVVPTVFYASCVHMPGSSFDGHPPPLDESQEQAKSRMAADLESLATKIGERHAGLPRAYDRALRFLEDRLRDTGLEPQRESFDASGTPCHNLFAESPGARQGAWVVVGAHYDTARGSPGANDDGSGVVLLLELARRLHSDRAEVGLRLVFFANEEPPHFRTDTMGSRVHARRAAERGETIVAMLSLETMGYFDDTPGSQKYPFPFGLLYPDTGNFLAVVGNFSSRTLVRSTISSFRQTASVPSEGAIVPEWIPGAGWSDHESFWLEGWPAVMITDTAPFRYPHYHEDTDTPDKVDTARLALAADGLVRVIRDLREQATGNRQQPTGNPREPR